VAIDARTGLLGGAFDPPHNGHVALALAAVEQLGLDRLLVHVVADPGHKDVFAPAADRLELARLAFAHVPGAEVELDPHARTVDSLEARQLDDPVLVLGADQLLALPRWKRPERVLELARLAVARRPGVPDERMRETHERLSAPGRITYFDLPPLPVSSTLVRERVARGQPIDDLVPPAVAEAVARLRLYTAD
jgi:nicotinate-nucleotide adenylyltransferase